MAMYELDGNHLLPVRLGRSADAITLSHSLVAIQRQIVDVLRRPLFPLAWDELDGGASLTALDATGQVVVVEVLERVDSTGLLAAMSRLTQAATAGRREIASRYAGGLGAFSQDWNEFREAMPAQAEAGELPLFVGGDESALEELAGVFEIIGAAVHRMGSVESATAFKLVSNLIGMTTVALVAEGYELCRASGVEPAAFLDALKDTGGWSYQADLRLPWMIDGDLDNRFGVDLALKDLRLAVEAAARLGVPTPVGAAGLMQLAAAHAQGYGDLDVAAIDRVVAPGE